MIDWLSVEMQVAEVIRAMSRGEPDTLTLLAEGRDQPRAGVRTRVAGWIVRLGLRLDPEVVLAVPVRSRA